MRDGETVGGAKKIERPAPPLEPGVRPAPPRPAGQLTEVTEDASPVTSGQFRRNDRAPDLGIKLTEVTAVRIAPCCAPHRPASAAEKKTRRSRQYIYMSACNAPQGWPAPSAHGKRSPSPRKLRMGYEKSVVEARLGATSSAAVLCRRLSRPTGSMVQVRVVRFWSAERIRPCRAREKIWSQRCTIGENIWSQRCTIDTSVKRPSGVDPGSAPAEVRSRLGFSPKIKQVNENSQESGLDPEARDSQESGLDPEARVKTFKARPLAENQASEWESQESGLDPGAGRFYPLWRYPKRRPSGPVRGFFSRIKSPESTPGEPASPLL